jgi:hypothetical protein
VPGKLPASGVGVRVIARALARTLSIWRPCGAAPAVHTAPVDNTQRNAKQLAKPRPGERGVVKADLITWLAGLGEDSPELGRVAAIWRGDDGKAAEGLLLLKELGQHPEVRLHHTMLWKLGIKQVAEDFGGRPRYRLSRALEYLRGPQCAARREELRRKRQEREEAKTR